MGDLQRAFDLLQLKPGASPEDVKRAFRRQVAAWHPDRFSADPAMERRAQERLRLAIEAHRTIVAYHASLAEGEGTVPPPEQGSEGHGPSGAAASFFRLVPNLVFCAMVLACIILAENRFGGTIHGWTYGVGMALIPTLFSLAHNLTGRRSPAVRNLYLGFSFVALAVVVVDGAMSGADRIAPAGVQEAFSPGRYEGDGVGGDWSLPQRGGLDTVGDALPSVLKESVSPRAPAVPLAPVAPAAPCAPVAPLVPPAR